MPITRYYSFPIKLLILSLFIIGEQTCTYGTNLYSYQSGDWNNTDTWTTDPGGTTLVGSQVPANGDIVIILSSRTVYLTGNVTATSLDISINSGGILNLADYRFTNTLAALRGEGTLQLNTTNFPAATTNEFVNTGGGTTEYRNSVNFTLPAAQTTYNNLVINLNNNSLVATQLSNITLNGNLNILNGIYRINDGNASRRRLTINGNVNIHAGSSMTVGTGNTTTTTNPIGISGGTAPFVNYYDQNTHRVVVSGDFTNDGTVRFTNQSYPVYTSFPTNGAASVYFIGGSHNTLTCNNTTDFYNLIVDKGTDQTFILSVNSSGYNYFRLFGANISGGENGGDNPILKKALWIRNGTLRLYGMVVIPSLTEGTCDGGLSGGPNSDYFIPSNGALVVDGPDVVLLTTADDYREINAAYGTSATTNLQVGVSTGGCSSFSVFGKFQIEDGYVSTRESGGLIYWATAAAQFIVNGGNLDAKQFRTANSSGGLTAYRQTGGTLTLRGRFQRTVNGVTNVMSLKSVPINTARADNGINGNVGTFNIDQDANLFEMSGGIIEILDVCGRDAGSIGRAFEVNSMPSYANVTGGTVLIKPTSGTVSPDYTYYLVSAAPIGNFTINQVSGTQDVQLTNITKGGVTPRDPPLEVLNNLTLAGANATLNAGNYDVIIGGNLNIPVNTTYVPGNNTTTFNTSQTSTFTYNGTISGGFNHLIIDKNEGSLIVSRTTPNTTSINGNFSILGGNFNDGGNIFNIYGIVINSGIHSGSGSLALTGTNTQTIGGDGNGIFQNLTLNNTNGAAGSFPVSLASGITVNGMLTLTSNRIFNIGGFNLNLTSTGNISGAFSATRFIATNGDIGDKGITKTFGSTSFVFPIGVIPTDIRYTPVTITLSTAPTTYGSITVFPVDAEQMQTNPNGKQRSLSYFWRERSAGFTLGSATLSQTFRYVDRGTGTDDVVTGGNVTEDGYVPARYNPYTFTWNKGNINDVDETNDIINWPNNVSYIDGDYTAGDDSPLSNDPFQGVTVFYSYQTGTWRGNTTWMTDTTNAGSVTSADPDQNTPVVIRNGHTVTCDNNSNRCGNLQIQKTGVLNCAAYNALNFGVVTNPLNGSGKIRISASLFPSGDFSEFRGTSGGTVEYYTNGSNYTLPITSGSADPLSYYKHLMISPQTGRNITLPNLNLTLYGDMIIQGGSATGVAQLNTASARSLLVSGDLTVASGNLRFGNGSSQNLTINGNLSVANGAIFNTLNSGATTNRITLAGNLTNDGTVNFNNSVTCDIEFTGISNAFFSGTGNTTLRYLNLNKGTSQSATLTIDVSGATFTTPVNSWLTLTNGTLRFMRNGDFNISTTSAFTIPANAGLYVDNNTVNVYIANSNSNDNDLYLQGKLTLVNGNVYIGPSAAPNNNNDIEYAGSGSSEIEILGGNLVVNGQIRRSPVVTSGVLLYNQSGGNVTINGNSYLATRAKFEVDNPGSVFNMSSGAITIIRGGGTTFGDLYIRPSSGSVTGGTILLGTQNVGVQTIRVDASIPLNNLTLDGTVTVNTFQLMVNPLELKGNLLINSANSILNTNSLDVTVKGNFTNNGIYTCGSNITTLNGSAQNISGTTATQFNDLIINAVSSVTLTQNITVNHDLSLLNGTFSTSTYNVNIKGNLLNNAVQTGNSATGGLLLNGTSVQSVSGSGTFGRLELNNAAGAHMESNISLQQNFLLTNGILDINQHLLTLGVNSNIVGAGFGINKMIKTDGVFSNIGIRKHFATGSGNFTYPIGVAGKYTPAVLHITANGSGGNVRINSINERHPTVSDQNNVLQYYWEVESNGISAFEGDLEFTYANTDVRGTESNYVSARLLIPPGQDWSKAATGPSTDNVDEVLDMINFDFPAGTSSLGGEYTAGSDAAIPDEVPVYTSNGDGNWDNINIWTPTAPAGGPNGFIVIIRSGDDINANGNRRFAYQTTINGVLNIGSSYGHNLGTVMGSGKLYLESPTLPAGRFNDFFSCYGGTLEFGGNTDYTIIADRIDTLRNLFFTGSGERVLPDKDIAVCDTLKLDGPSVRNDIFNHKIFLFGTIRRLNSATFTSGSGPDATLVFAGFSPQTIGGVNGNFTGINMLNNIEINNEQGLTLQSPLELKGNLELTQGVVYSSSANKLSMLNGNAAVIPSGGSSASYISGPVSKRIFGGNDFAFPTGKDSRYGATVIIGVSDGTWESEYFNSGFPSTSVTAPLTAVSSFEYWHIKGPGGKQAYVKLRWDHLSDITPLTTLNGLTDIRVAEYNTGTLLWVEKSTSASGDNYDGTALTMDKMDLDEHDYTLGSVSSLKPRANFLDTDDACEGDDLLVSFTNSAATYNFTYNIDGGSDIPVTTSSNPHTIITSGSGRYRITGFNGGVVDTNSVWVMSVPTATLFSNDADNIICEGDNVIFTAGGGTNYQFYVNGSSVQSGVTSTFSTVSLSNGDAVYVVVTNASGCNDISLTLTTTVNPRPAPVLTGNLAVCTDAIETYNTEPGMSGYVWSVTGGTITSGGTATDADATITWNTIGSQTISVNYTDANGCTAITPVQLPVDVFKRPETGPSYYVPNNHNQ